VEVKFEGSGIPLEEQGLLDSLLQGVAVGDGPGRWADLPDEIHVTRRLAGGRSGAEVFEAVVRRGHNRSRKVIKLGPLHDLGNEFNAFQGHLNPPPSALFVPIEAVSARLLDENAAPLEREVVVYSHAAAYHGADQSTTRTFEELAREAIQSDDALRETAEALDRLFAGIRGGLYGHWRAVEESTSHRAFWNWRLGFDAVVGVEHVDAQRKRLDSSPAPATLYPRDIAKRSISNKDDRAPVRIDLGRARVAWWGNWLVAETAGPHFLRVRIESEVDGEAIRHLAREVKDGEEWTVEATVQSWRHHDHRDRLSESLGDQFEFADGRLSGPGASLPDPLAVLAGVMDAERAGRVTCVAHGDLNPRNILLVGRDVCLIDYALTGDGQPLLADFVRLEGNLVQEVLSAVFTWPELVRLGRYLAVACRLEQDGAAEKITRRLAAERAELGRAFRLLWAVRRAARDVTPEPMRPGWDRDYLEQLFLFGHQMMKWLAPDNGQAALASAAISGVAAESLRLDRVFDLWPADTIREDALLILSQMRGQAERFLAELASLGRRLVTLDLKANDPLWQEFREVRGELVRVRFAEAARRIREQLEADHDVFINLKAYIDLKGQLKAAARRRSRALSADELLTSDVAMAERERLRARKDRPGEDALDLIAAHPALVLLGDAGAGKSTIAREWEYQLAKAILGETDGDWEPRLPIVVRASAVAGRLGDWKEDAPAAQTAAVVECELESTPVDLFESGAATVVVDALNELADAEKQRVAEWVMTFHDRFPLTPLLVCHRQYNYPAGLLPFPIVTLEKVERQQAERYIRDYLREKLDESRTGAADPAELADELIRLLLKNPDHKQVRDLAQTPLFLWMIVEHYRQKQELPENRARLFDDFSRWYLEERHHTEHEEPAAAQYEYALKADLLGRLGYELVQRRATELPEAEVERIASPSDDPHQPEAQARDLTDSPTTDPADAPIEEDDESPSLALRVSVEWPDILEEIIAAELLHREDGSLRFLHQSFQEYFAARHFLEHHATDPQEVRRRVLEFRFHDMFVLVLGFGGNNPDVVRQVVERALEVNAGLTARCLRMAETDDRSLLDRFVAAQQVVLGDHDAGDWSHGKAAAALADYGRGPARRALWTIAADPAAPQTARCRSLEQLARLPEQVRFETVADRIRGEFVERLPGVFNEPAPTAVGRAAIDAIVRTKQKDLSGYLIDLLTGGEWPLRRAAWEACGQLGLPLTPRQRDTYSTACAEQLETVERELYEETVLDRMGELNDERVAILEQLATPANLPLLLRRRFAYIVEWSEWNERVAELIDGLSKDSPVGQASSPPSTLETCSTKAWTILTEEPKDQPAAVARWSAAFRGPDELAALAAAHRLAYGGGMTVVANRTDLPVELSPTAQERIHELAEAEQDFRRQLWFADAAAQYHAVALLGWLAGQDRRLARTGCTPILRLSLHLRPRPGTLPRHRPPLHRLSDPPAAGRQEAGRGLGGD